MKDWLRKISDNAQKNVKVILLGNKNDLNFNRKVSEAEIQKFSLEKNIPYTCVSAKTGEMVHDCLLKLTQKIFIDITENEIKVDQQGSEGVKKGNLGEDTFEDEFPSQKKSPCCN